MQPDSALCPDDCGSADLRMTWEGEAPAEPQYLAETRLTLSGACSPVSISMFMASRRNKGICQLMPTDSLWMSFGLPATVVVVASAMSLEGTTPGIPSPSVNRVLKPTEPGDLVRLVPVRMDSSDNDVKSISDSNNPSVHRGDVLAITHLSDSETTVLKANTVGTPVRETRGAAHHRI